LPTRGQAADSERAASAALPRPLRAADFTLPAQAGRSGRPVKRVHLLNPPLRSNKGKAGTVHHK
jgi:hypothetical protein